MARAQNTDFMQSMRFLVTVVNVGGGAPTAGGTGFIGAGFSSCSTPGMSLESVEYKEGQMVYSRKQPGNPQMDDVSLAKGVARKSGDFYDWTRTVAEGGGEYRIDFDILHLHRIEGLPRGTTGRVSPSTSRKPHELLLNPGQKAARIYHVLEAFPTRFKPASDMDATASEISISELDVAYEDFWMDEVDDPST